MDAKQALDAAKTASAQRRVRVSRHGREQMECRCASWADVLEAVFTATSAIYDPGDPPREKWRFEGGRDVDGDGLVLVVEFTDGEARVVTVFGP